MLVQSKILSLKNLNIKLIISLLPPCCPNVLFTGISEGNGLLGYVRHRGSRHEFIWRGSSQMIRRTQLHLVMYLVIKIKKKRKSKDHLHMSVKLHHTATVTLRVACILVISVISDSQCRLNKGTFHGSVNLLLKNTICPCNVTWDFNFWCKQRWRERKQERNGSSVYIRRTDTHTNTHTDVLTHFAQVPEAN